MQTKIFGMSALICFGLSCRDSSDPSRRSPSAPAEAFETVHAAISRPANTPPAALASQATGRLSGGGEVGMDGHYKHRIAIDVPPGRAGMQPEIELRYSSSTGNGLAGVGWSVGGPSVIERCREIAAFAGRDDKIRFRPSDKYCLDGQLLVLKSGTYGASPSEYRTEIDGFSKITVTASNAEGPLAWTVRRKDGRIQGYGVSPDVNALSRVERAADGSAQVTQTVQLRWPLIREVDRAGNAIAYDYEGSAVGSTMAVPILKSITYTLCDLAPCGGYSDATRRRIDFIYNSRAAGEVLEGYINGAWVRTEKRLSSIQTNILDGSAWRRVLAYNLTYVQSALTKRSLLDAVQVCDAANVCLPKTTFDYQTETAAPVYTTKGLEELPDITVPGYGYRASLAIPPDVNGPDENAIALADVDGDGNDDVMFKHWLQVGTNGRLDEGHTINTRAPRDMLLIANGNGFFGVPGGNGTADFQVIDHDGDGVDPSEAPCQEWEVEDFGRAVAADIDGDGRNEILAPLIKGCPFIATTPRWTRSKGETWGALSWDSGRRTLVWLPMALAGPEPGGRFLDTWPAKDEVRAVDLTGDGLPELMFGSLDFLNSNRGKTWFWLNAIHTPHTFPPVTHNLVKHETYMPANPVRRPYPNAFQVLDEDADGHLEAVTILKGSEVWSYSVENDGFGGGILARDAGVRCRRVVSPQRATFETRDSIIDPQPPVLCIEGPTAPEWHFVDVNGDGLKDAVYREKQGTSSTYILRVRFNTGAGYGPPLLATASAADALHVYPLDEKDGTRVADMNGDGFEDLVMLWPTTTDNVDVNSVLTASGYRYHAGEIRIAYSNGAGFLPPVQMQLALPGGAVVPVDFRRRLYHPEKGWHMTQIGDVDGNGLPDIVEMVGVSSRTLLAHAMQLPGGPDLLIAVNDESGVAEKILYDNLSGGSQARLSGAGWDGLEARNTATPDFALGTCSHPAPCTSTGRAVRFYENNREDRNVRRQYAYSGARRDTAGRGSLGFWLMSVRDMVTGLVTTHEFDQHPHESVEGAARRIYARLGAPIKTTVKVTTGPHAADLANAEGAIPWIATTRNPVYDGYPLALVSEQATTTVFEELGQTGGPRREHKNTVRYDGFGNPQEITDRTTDIDTGIYYETASETFYDNHENLWFIGLPNVRAITRSTNADVAGNGCTAAVCRSSSQEFDYHFTNGLLDQVIREPNAPANANMRQVVDIGRDGAGLVRTLTTRYRSPDGVERSRATSMTYDTHGATRESFTNAAGHVNWTLSDPKTAWLFLTADANGQKTIYTRDGFGRVRQEARDDGGLVTTDYSLRSITQAVSDGPRSRLFFDVRGRPQFTTWSTFANGTALAQVFYDSLGHGVTTRFNTSTKPHTTVALTLLNVLTALNTAGVTEIQRASYDVLGRIRSSANGGSVAESGGGTTTTRYLTPLGLVETTDPMGYRRQDKVDANGRLVSRADRLEDSQQRWVTTGYVYNELGQLARVRPPVGPEDRFESDRLGRSVAWRTGSLTRRTRNFDAIDEMVGQVQDGISTTYVRDALGRVTQRISGAETQTYGWDVGTGALGRMTSATTNAGSGHTTTFTYDTLGRLSERREAFAGGESLSLGYSYDGRGRLQDLRYPETSDADVFNHFDTGGLTVRYGYQNGQIASISEVATGNPVLWRVMNRDGFGRITESKDAAGVTHKRGYYPDSLKLQSSSTTGITSGPLPGQTYAYQANGLLRTLRSNSAEGGTIPTRIGEIYGYDGLRRLVTYHREEDGGSLIRFVEAAFSYTDGGNMTGVDTTASTESPDWPFVDETYSYADAGDPHRLTAQAIGSTNRTFTHSGGRLTEVREGGTLVRTYSYNSFSLPTRVRVQNTSANRTVDYVYDAFGKRVRELVDTSSDTNSILIGDLYVGNNAQNDLVDHSIFRLLSDEGVVGVLQKHWRSTSARQTWTSYADKLGTPVFHSLGTVAGSPSALKFPFGRRMVPGVGIGLDALGYTGRRQDDDLGLVDMKGRVYDVVQRRFISRDPIVDRPFKAGGTNPYAYVLNDPVNNTDPNGLQTAGCGDGCTYTEGVNMVDEVRITNDPTPEQMMNGAGGVGDSIRQSSSYVAGVEAGQGAQQAAEQNAQAEARRESERASALSSAPGGTTGPQGIGFNGLSQVTEGVTGAVGLGIAKSYLNNFVRSFPAWDAPARAVGHTAIQNLDSGLAPGIWANPYKVAGQVGNVAGGIGAAYNLAGLVDAIQKGNAEQQLGNGASLASELIGRAGGPLGAAFDAGFDVGSLITFFIEGDGSPGSGWQTGREAMTAVGGWIVNGLGIRVDRGAQK
jgi:RHS repeat-associated protein